MSFQIKAASHSHVSVPVRIGVSCNNKVTAGQMFVTEIAQINASHFQRGSTACMSRQELFMTSAITTKFEIQKWQNGGGDRFVGKVSQSDRN